MNKHVVVFSHGFGVRKDARGMFTDIAAALTDCETVLFDYCKVDPNGDTHVPPLPEQAKKLHDVIDQARRQHPDATIDLVCHSQGCLAAGLAEPYGVRRIILLTPPTNVSAKTHAERMSWRGAKNITPDTMQIARRDGTTTFLTPEYWESLNHIDAIKLYNRLSELSDICLVTANDDDLLKTADFSGLAPEICCMGIDGNHNFDGDARQELIKLIKMEFL